MSGARYWWKAFNARPFGMPVPPNWIGLAAFGLLGLYLSPGFLLVGAGLELAYLAGLGNSARFRAVVDATSGEKPSEADLALDRRYQSLFEQLAYPDRRRQQQIEARAREILDTLERTPLRASHGDSLEQLVWLHLRLLAAQSAIRRVSETAQREQSGLVEQTRALQERLKQASLGDDLRRSLEQQLLVIEQRQKGHADAAQRLEHMGAELARIEQQIALIHEQALLATDDAGVAASLNALSHAFNETNRWLSDQRELLGMIEFDSGSKLPRRVLARTPPQLPQGESS